jgi:hypothetical protein
MAVSSTVSPGIVLQDGQTVTISDLNKLGTPTVSIDGAVGTLSLTDGSVTNAKVASAAGIQLDKIQSGSAAQVVVANSSGVPTYVALSGDATISDAGALTLAADSVETAQITAANVTTAKIADDAVTADKLANTAVTAGSYEKADITVDAQGRVTAAASNATNATARVEGFTGSGTWTAPTGVTRAKFTLVGGGGGYYANSGSGPNYWAGGSGAICIVTATVTPATAYSLTVGGGGTGGSFGSNAGGSTTVTIGATTYTAGGGTNQGSSGQSSIGGTATNGDINISGVDGGTYNQANAGGFWGNIGSGGGYQTSSSSGFDGIAIVEWME